MPCALDGRGGGGAPHLYSIYAISARSSASVADGLHGSQRNSIVVALTSTSSYDSGEWGAWRLLLFRSVFLRPSDWNMPPLCTFRGCPARIVGALGVVSSVGPGKFRLLAVQRLLKGCCDGVSLGNRGCKAKGPASVQVNISVTV